MGRGCVEPCVGRTIEYATRARANAWSGHMCPCSHDVGVAAGNMALQVGRSLGHGCMYVYGPEYDDVPLQNMSCLNVSLLAFARCVFQELQLLACWSWVSACAPFMWHVAF